MRKGRAHGHAVPRRSQRIWANRLLLIVALQFVALAVTLGTRYASESDPPATPAHAMGTIPAPSLTPDPPTAAPRPAAYTVASSPPSSLTIPAIGVKTSLVQLGLAATGAIQVPTSFHIAGWYDLGPTPGALGPAVIVGHVDSYQGPGVFYRLGQTKPGETITVGLADGAQPQFRIDAVDVYTKTAFPTHAVYGDTNYAGLRVITCGGAFDNYTRSYESNIVIYASLVRPSR